MTLASGPDAELQVGNCCRCRACRYTTVHNGDDAGRWGRSRVRRAVRVLVARGATRSCGCRRANAAGLSEAARRSAASKKHQNISIGKAGRSVGLTPAEGARGGYESVDHPHGAAKAARRVGGTVTPWGVPTSKTRKKISARTCTSFAAGRNRHRNAEERIPCHAQSKRPFVDHHLMEKVEKHMGTGQAGYPHVVAPVDHHAGHGGDDDAVHNGQVCSRVHHGEFGGPLGEFAPTRQFRGHSGTSKEGGSK